MQGVQEIDTQYLFKPVLTKFVLTGSANLEIPKNWTPFFNSCQKTVDGHVLVISEHNRVKIWDFKQRLRAVIERWRAMSENKVQTSSLLIQLNSFSTPEHEPKEFPRKLSDISMGSGDVERKMSESE